MPSFIPKKHGTRSGSGRQGRGDAMTREQKAKLREVVCLEDDLRALFEHVLGGGDDIAKRGHYGELVASPEYYRTVADQFMDFVMFHPEDARSVLAGLLLLIEKAPFVREETLKRRAALKKAGVL